MEKLHIVTGYCPILKKDIACRVTYIFNVDSWEKGVSEPPCSTPCDDGCPIIQGAPEELKTI